MYSNRQTRYSRNKYSERQHEAMGYFYWLITTLEREVFRHQTPLSTPKVTMITCSPSTAYFKCHSFRQNGNRTSRFDTHTHLRYSHVLLGKCNYIFIQHILHILYKIAFTSNLYSKLGNYCKPSWRRRVLNRNSQLCVVVQRILLHTTRKQAMVEIINMQRLGNNQNGIICFIRNI